MSVLRFGRGGALLISGSNANDIILWDVVNEAGLFRLQGHKGHITDLILVEEENILFSSSKDTYVKVWDLETQHCVCTLVGHRTEVTSIALDPTTHTKLVSGTTDNELRVWNVTYNVRSELQEEVCVGQ